MSTEPEADVEPEETSVEDGPVQDAALAETAPVEEVVPVEAAAVKAAPPAAEPVAPVVPTVAPPHGRYRRGPRGANFTLEANTENVPGDGRFYILVDEKVTLATEDFAESVEEYNRLCREFWTPRLEDEDVLVKVAAAWGILTLSPNDKISMEIIQKFGTPQEKKRLDQAQSRRRALRARSGQRG